MSNPIRIANRLIGPDQPPFIVAEMSANHNQSLEIALKIVEAASNARVHAIKLQTYTPDTLTIDEDGGTFVINDNNSLWNGFSLYKLYKQAYTPWEWHEPIFKRCKELGLIAFSTPFDETSVDFLESLKVPAYKIASFEINHLPLIHRVASTGKPMIISTGMATVAEIDEAMRNARENGCKDIILLKCTSTYPAKPEDSNLLTIPHMKQLFGTEVGLSDHTPGFGATIAGIALGAAIIEKHFTLSRGHGGVDSAFSMEPEEMRLLVIEAERAWQAIGKIHYGPMESERSSVRFKRSIYAVEEIMKGEEFTSKNLRIIRPSGGLHPRYYNIILGKKAVCKIKKGTPLSWEFVV